MINHKKSNKNAYFAAANSFYGFVSLFSEIFDPDGFCKIYILKGGPGTGKSTLMRRISDFASQKLIDCEEIYCSSDTSSLDGVILTNKDKRIAVIDGTKPHMQDPIYPGAVDEIVNLSEGFNIAALEERRDDIESLVKLKSKEYNSAYTYLSSAEKIFSFLFDNYKRSFCSESFISDVKKELKSREECYPNERRRYYVSAFGKDGVVRMKSKESENKRTVSISGDGISEFIAMECLYTYLSSRQYLEVICPHPFSATLYDAILTLNDAFIINAEAADTVICADEYCISESCSHDMFDEYQRLIRASQRSFARASDYHMQIEAIYKEAVDFKKNDEVYLSLIEKIEDKLYI